MEINELKDIWISKEAPKHLSLQLEKEGIIAQLYKLQRQTVFAGLFVSICFAIVFVVLGMIGGEMVGQSLYFDIGATIVFIDMIIALAFIWSLVISWREKRFTLDSVNFIEIVLFRMERRKFVLKTVIPIYILTLALGINLTYLYSLQGLAISERILIHAAMTFALVLGMIFSWIKQKGYVRKTLDPLIEDLKQIRLSLLDNLD